MSAIIENGVLVKYNHDPNETSYEIPEGVTEIGDYAFQAAFRQPTYLTELKIPNTVTRIGEFALSGLRNVKELVVPDSVTELGRGCFCSTGFKRLVIGKGVKTLPPFMDDGGFTLNEIILSDGLEEICTSALGAVRGMRVLHIPETVKIFRRRALTGSDIFLDGEVNFPKNVELVENLAFDGASGIDTVDLAPGLKKVWEGSFSGCLSLRTVNFSDSITEIGYKAFAYCKKLSKVNLNRGLKVIGERAFSGDSSLTEITLPDGVEEIAPKAFYACVNLKKINIPDSVKVIGKDAFYNCPWLENLELPAHLESQRAAAFTPYEGATGHYRFE